MCQYSLIDGCRRDLLCTHHRRHHQRGNLRRSVSTSGRVRGDRGRGSIGDLFEMTLRRPDGTGEREQPVAQLGVRSNEGSCGINNPSSTPNMHMVTPDRQSQIRRLGSRSTQGSL
ncbi:hypothetical protein FRB91_003387 [Serendipita sp. 411]|nr:hypothetical protein FRB91_003387 [Serendipita sp. 411]